VRNEGKSTFHHLSFWIRTRSGSIVAVALLLPSFFFSPSGPLRPIQPQAPLTVAVLELTGEDLSPADAWLTSAIAEAIEHDLFRSGAVRLVERRFLAQVFEEISLQLSGAVAEETAVDVGRLSGAAMLVTGTVANSGGSIRVRLRVLDVQTAEVRELVEGEAPPERLRGLEEDLGYRLSLTLRIEEGRRRGETTPPPPLPLRAAEGLYRADLLVARAPLAGLDPARSRRRADYMLALDLAERALSEQPDLPSAHLTRGIALLNLDDPGRAIEAFEQAIRLDPDESRARLWLAGAYQVAGSPERALAAAREGVARAPEDGTARLVLGRLLASAGDGEGAAVAFLEALERAPGLSDAESGLRVLLTGPEAAGRITRLESVDPGLAAAARLYQAFWARAKRAEARDIEQVQTRRPRLFLGPYWAGLEAQQARDYATAETRLRAALALHPEGPEVHRELGRILLLARRCTEGARHVRLYFRTARTVDDADELQRLIDGCRERR
jgi:tetratricopeptide (TPR) repeat protein/TolB-like protein